MSIADLSDKQLEKAKSEIKVNEHSFTLSDLLNVDFPPLVWYVDRLITPGLTLLWGYAKTGKSILILGVSLAVALGGKAIGQFDTQISEVLLISLEDGPRRLQSRFKAAGAEPTENLHIKTQWPRASKGIESLKAYLDQNDMIKVVVIDTLMLFSKLQDSNDYSQTTGLMESLKRIADERDLCIICIHHSKKTSRQDSDADFTQSALGSTGIVAGADHLICLKKTPSGSSDAILYFTSKDATPSELALNFDSEIGGWKYAGEAQDLVDTDERQEIIDLLREKGAMKTGEIAKALNKKTNTISYLLGKMLEKEQVRKLHYGLYTVPGEYIPPESPETPESSIISFSTSSSFRGEER